MKVEILFQRHMMDFSRNREPWSFENINRDINLSLYIYKGTDRNTYKFV